MPSKQFTLDEQTVITIYKHKKSRSLRLSIKPNGEIRVTIPLWAPYKTGLTFAKSRAQWIQEQRKPVTLLQDGMAIGKAHHLRLLPSDKTDKITTRLVQSEIYVKYPTTTLLTDKKLQRATELACIRALRKEAENLLPQRLATLATQYNFTYKSVTIKQLRSRWGSCDQHTNIVLNLFLMQLPWECIDYVLLHELTHTQIMQHGPVFWAAMDKVVPQLARVRKEMRTFQPILT